MSSELILIILTVSCIPALPRSPTAGTIFDKVLASMPETRCANFAAHVRCANQADEKKPPNQGGFFHSEKCMPSIMTSAISD